MSGSADDLQTLNQQIMQAESLTSGSYTITLSGDIAYSAAIDAIKLHSGVTLTIDGGGHTLDPAGAAGGLRIVGGTVDIDDLTISHATAKGGVGAEGGGGGAGLGGGLFVGATANVTLDQVSFTHDSAIGGAGAKGGVAAKGSSGDDGLSGGASATGGAPGGLYTGGYGGVGAYGGNGGNGGDGGGGGGGGAGGGGFSRPWQWRRRRQRRQRRGSAYFIRHLLWDRRRGRTLWQFRRPSLQWGRWRARRERR